MAQIHEIKRPGVETRKTVWEENSKNLETIGTLVVIHDFDDTEITLEENKILTEWRYRVSRREPESALAGTWETVFVP